MWQDKLKEIIYILENSNINEIEVNFWGRKYRVVKNANIMVQDESAQIQSSNALPKDKNTPLEESEVSETVPPASLAGEDLLSPLFFSRRLCICLYMYLSCSLVISLHIVRVSFLCFLFFLC